MCDFKNLADQITDLSLGPRLRDHELDPSALNCFTGVQTLELEWPQDLDDPLEMLLEMLQPSGIPFRVLRVVDRQPNPRPAKPRSPPSPTTSLGGWSDFSASEEEEYMSTSVLQEEEKKAARMARLAAEAGAGRRGHPNRAHCIPARHPPSHRLQTAQNSLPSSTLRHRRRYLQRGQRLPFPRQPSHPLQGARDRDEVRNARLGDLA